MAKRGRPRYPDILTPREWEVLALLREEVNNEQIAERLDITERTARYHVSEILGKLGVGSRADAAGWDPEQRPWWMTAVAPLAFVWRKASFGWLSPAAAAAVAVVVIGGVGLPVWGLVRTQGNEGVGPPISSVLVDPPDELVWSGMVSVDSGTCGDPATAEALCRPTNTMHDSR